MTAPANRLRRWLAARLDPETAFEAERLRIIRSRLSDAYWWLGEFPDSTDTIRWILDTEADAARKIGEPARSKLPHDIGEFREHLRRRAALSKARGETP